MYQARQGSAVMQQIMWKQYGQVREIIEVEDGIWNEDADTFYFMREDGTKLPMPKHKIIAINGRVYNGEAWAEFHPTPQVVLIMDKRLAEGAVRSIIALTKEHKGLCEADDCGVSTCQLGEVVSHLMGRPLTKEEAEVFI